MHLILRHGKRSDEFVDWRSEIRTDVSITMHTYASMENTACCKQRM
jgi:hypothetical protein